MSHQLGNLLDCPMHKIEDRKSILERTFAALVDDPDAVLDFKGGHRYTADESANWAARQTVANIITTFPPSSNQAADFWVVRTESVDS